MQVSADSVTWYAAQRAILQTVTVEAAPGSLVGVIGPNGSGKTTLLRCIYRVLRPAAGWVGLDGQDVWRLSERQAAQRMAVVLQEAPTEFDFTTREVVEMGRTPHKGPFASESEADQRLVDEALARTGLTGLAGRPFATLSGGEKQRAYVARALAQQAQLLVLDEPTNHLDVRYQFEILNLVRNLGVTTLMSLHDLNLAAHYCDYLYLLQAGCVAAGGPPEEVLQPDLIAAVYGVRAETSRHPTTGRLHITFLPPTE